MKRIDYSAQRQHNLNHWFRMFTDAGILTRDDYHEYCKWVRGKNLGDVFPLIQKKINPLAEKA